MRVLIIGGLGYVGSSIAAELNSRGHELVLVGRRPTEFGSTFGEVHVWDATKEWTGSTPNFDAVLHLASSNGDYSLDLLETYLDNLAVTRNILKLCQQIPNSAILYVSTLQVYGRWTGELSVDTPVSPTSDYSFSHWVAEEHVKMFARDCNRKSLVVRLSNVIGAGVDQSVIRWSTVPADFCLQAVKQRFIDVRSSGQELRDFIPVSEVSRQIGDLVENLNYWTGRTKLIATGQSVTIGSVAEAVSQRAQDLLGVPIPVNYRRKSRSNLDESELRIICNTSDVHQLRAEYSVPSLVDSIDDLLKAALRKIGSL